MYTKQEIIDYFQNVGLKERDMIFNLHDMMTLVEDKALIARLKVVADDEVRHYSLVQKTIISVMGAAFERRMWERKYVLGKATLKEQDSNKQIQARCIDMSFGGVCIDFESRETIVAEKKYQIRIEFFDSTTPINRVGRVRWMRKINDELYTCGITFLDETENIYFMPPTNNI